ncbi:hypothetical protein RAS1_15870 [Phycisphaerae bacterium RAS1]|nr:hypothetical protein RAS1_15870 [Phycisphaerae bacterium RAS1]
MSRRLLLIAGTLVLLMTAWSPDVAPARPRADGEVGFSQPPDAAAPAEPHLPAQPGEFGGEWPSVTSDLIVGETAGPRKWGTATVDGMAMTSYSHGWTGCNVGSVPLQWIDGTPNHPVIGGNIYRLRNGRIEQLGQSWLKWEFCCLEGGVCGACSPYCGACCDHLGVGCSSPSTADRCGSQSLLGPRWIINPSTGVFTQNHPHPGSGTLDGRIVVRNDDLNPALNSGALFFGELLTLSPDDAAAGNGENNMSYKRLNVGAFTGGGYALGFTGLIARTLPAIYAWQAHGGGLNVPDPNVVIQTIDVTDGRLVLGYKAALAGNGLFHYEFALLNVNSDASVGSFSIPAGDAADVLLADIGFKDVDYGGDGMPYDLSDWPNNAGADGLLTWATTPFPVNPNANALRFGTMYNFRFDARTSPVDRLITIGRFKTGDSITVPGKGPAPLGDMNCDGVLDILDINAFTLALADPAAYAAAYPGCAATNGDMNADGQTDILDINPFADALAGG